MKTKIKALEEELQAKVEEIKLLHRRDNPLWMKRRLKIEQSYAKVLNLRVNVAYWQAVGEGETLLPLEESQSLDSEVEFLTFQSQTLRDRLFETDKVKFGLNFKLTEIPSKKKSLETKITQIKERIQNSSLDFHSIRSDLGLEWMDFNALEGFLNGFKKENKPRITFLKENLE